MRHVVAMTKNQDPNQKVLEKEGTTSDDFTRELNPIASIRCHEAREAGKLAAFGSYDCAA